MKKQFFRKLKKAICIVLGMTFFISATACKKKASEENNPIEVTRPTVIAESNVSLVSNGTSPYKIVLPDEPDSNEIFASEEIQSIFYQSTGVTLPVIASSQASADFSQCYISLGDTVLREKANVSVENLKATGYTLQRKDNTLIILGKTKLATLYGAYEFLERNLGYVYYANDEVYVDSLYNKQLLDFNYSYEPSLTYSRMTHYSRQFTNVDARFKTGNTPLAWGWPHSFNYTVRPSEYKQFYKSGNTTSLCLTDKNMWEVAYQAILKRFLEDPTLEYYCFAQEDKHGSCSCADCQASNEIYTYTGTYMIVGNYLARRIKEYFKENDPSREPKILLLAYFDSETPPVKTEKVDGEEKILPIAPEVVAEDNVYVQVCPIWQDFASSIYSSNNDRTLTMLKNWKVIAGDRLWAYIYDGCEVHNNMLYFFDWEYKAETLQTLVDLGYQQVQWETTSSRLSSFEKMRLYHTANLIFDTSKDSNQLISDFITNYYKEAAPYIQEYFDTLNLNFKLAQAELAKENKVLGQHVQLAMNKYLYDERLWPELMLENVLKLFDKALQAIEKSEKYTPLKRMEMIERVKREQIFPRYYQLLIYKTSFENSVYQKMVDEFNADVAELGGTIFI